MYNSFDSLNSWMMPWLLTHICRCWRQLGLQLPRLWPCLLLDVYKQSRCGMTRHQCTYEIRLFLKRSNGLSMTVYLDSNKCLLDHLVLSVLKISIPCWVRLWVDLPPTSLQYFSGNPFLSLHILEFYNLLNEG